MNEFPTVALREALEQIDRDAAADIYRRFRYGATVEIQAKIRREIEQGQRDDDPIVQVFARHRIAALSQSTSIDGEGVERARAAVQELADTRTDLPLERWSELSSRILAALPELDTPRDEALWCDAKYAFSIANDEALEALKPSAPPPSHWRLEEVTISGAAGFVALFRYERVIDQYGSAEPIIPSAADTASLVRWLESIGAEPDGFARLTNTDQVSE